MSDGESKSGSSFWGDALKFVTGEVSADRQAKREREILKAQQQINGTSGGSFDSNILKLITRDKPAPGAQAQGSVIDRQVLNFAGLGALLPVVLVVGGLLVARKLGVI